MSCILDLVDLGSGDVFGVNATNALAVQVDLQHDLGGRLPVFAEELLQNPHNELHGGEVVIEHDHLVHLGWLSPLGAAL